MFKKTSKSFVLLGGLLVFSLLLASCQSMTASIEQMERTRAVDAWGANLTAQGEQYLEEMTRQKAMEAWGANLTAQGERYLEEAEQASIPWIELRSDVPAPAMEQITISLVELRSDVPAPRTEAMIDAIKPGVGIQRTWMYARTFSTAYTVMSNRPVWVVFHSDQDGLAGEILQHIYVGSGINKIVRTENLGEMSSRQVHVMLHEDLGRTGLFEFPGSDGPMFIEDQIVNELCFCPF